MLKKNFFHIIILIIFLFPGGMSIIFNGLPFDGKFETIFFIIIPLYYIIDKEFFFKKSVFRFLVFICFFKIVSLFGPTLGIKHKVYDAQEEKNYIKTYESFWNDKVSSIQTYNWPEKTYFSIDWLPGATINSDNNFPTYEDEKQYEKINLNYKSEFYFISNGTFFRVKDLKTEQINSFKIFDYFKNKKINFDRNKVVSQGIYLPEGLYEIQLETEFKKNWKLKFENNFKFLNKNFYISSFKQSNIIYDIKNINNLNSIKIFKFVSNIIDILFFIFFIILNICLIIYLYKKKYISSFAFFLILLILLFKNFQNLSQSIIYVRFYDTIILSLTLLIFYFYLIIINRFKISQLKLDIDFVKVFFGILLIFFFSTKFIGTISVLDLNNFNQDDWLAFQIFAREIVVDSSIPHPDTIYRPGVRYILAFENIIFGKSNFSTKMFQVWLLYAAIFLVFKIIYQITQNNLISLSGSFLASVFFIGENFIIYLGKGLSSYYAYPIILFLSYYFLSTNMTIKNIWKILPLVIIISWLREEYIILVASLIIFSPQIGNNFYKRNLFFYIYSLLKNKFVQHYILVIILSISSVFFNNFLVMGDFSFVHPNVGFGYKESSIIESIFRLITGTNSIGEFPRFYSLIFLIVLILSLLNIFKFFTFKEINPGLFFSIISIYFTYLFMTNANYNPRFCLNLFFLSVIYLFVIINHLMKNSNYFLFFNKFFSKKQ